MNISNAGEFQLIGLFRRLLEGSSRADVVGIGDDCCVVPLGAGLNLYLTTDASIEGVHFRRETTSASDLGWKALAVSLSDLAAMGGEPLGALVSLHLPPSIPVAWLESLYQGLKEISQEFSCPILGGDTVSATELSITTTVAGRGEKPLLRSGAQEGDLVFVSGGLGKSGAGLRCLERGMEPVGGEEKVYLDAHRRPYPRLDLGKSLVGIATAAIDISDGFFQDLGHLTEASALAASIDLESLPTKGLVPLEAASAGEDYELIFTAPANTRQQVESRFPEVACVGSLRKADPTQSERIFLTSGSGEIPLIKVLEASKIRGFDHFR